MRTLICSPWTRLWAPQKGLHCFPSGRRAKNDLLNSALFPEPPKDQVRPDALYGDSLSLSGGMRIDKGKLFAMTQPRAYQRLKPSAGLEFNRAGPESRRPAGAPSRPDGRCEQFGDIGRNRLF
jgi:hypothetical protein